jgi:putative transposase
MIYNEWMNASTHHYAGYRYPAEIISHAVWLYFRFTLSFRNVEELLAARGIGVTYEAVRQWCLKFGQQYAKEIQRRRPRPGDTWYMDEVFITINGVRHYLWRAVDQDGDVLDILVQKHRDKRAAKRFFRKLLKGLRYAPRRIVIDKLRSYGAARKEVLPDVSHDNDNWQNNRAENPHQPTRQRERQMRRFKSAGQAQRFLSAHGPINNLFRLGRHHMKAAHYRLFRDQAFALWQEVTCVQNAG